MSKKFILDIIGLDKTPSSSGLGHLVFSQRIAGSNPAGVTESNSLDVSFKKKYYIYILFSLKDKRFYIGFTEDLKRRLTEHATGLVSSTKARRPLKLIHYEYFINKPDAKAREVFLKSGFGRNQLKKSLKRTLIKLGYYNL